MKLEFTQRKGCEGLQWRFTTNDGKHSLSIICHKYSYGWEDGLFETQCSWLPDVQERLKQFINWKRKAKND